MMYITVLSALRGMLAKGEFNPVLGMWWVHGIYALIGLGLIFIPEMKIRYALTKSSKKTIVMGLSMGGFGALRFTMLNPEHFGICVSFMGAISTKKQMIEDLEKYYQRFHAHLYGENLTPKERTNEVYLNNNPLYIAEKVDVKILRSKKWYIQTCDDDFHSLPNSELHILFHQKKILQQETKATV